MRTPKLFAGVAAAAALVLALAGCSASSTGTKAADPSEVSGKITYAFWDPNQKAAMDKIVAAFEKKYPKVTVTDSVVPYAQYWTTLQTEASSNTLPDVFWMNMPYFQLYAANGQLAPIDDLVKGKQIDVSAYPANLTKFYTYGGKRYAVPKDVDTNAMWVNKALFKQAGVSIPVAGWTYDDYRALAKQIRQKLGSKGIYGTSFYLFGQTTYYSSVFAYGGQVIDGTKSGWDTPASEKGLQIWRDLVSDGSSPTIQQLSETTADQWFVNGKAAMYPSIAGASVAEMAGAKSAADFVAIPLPQGTKQATVGHALSNVVSAKSKNLAAAQAFQAFTASKQAQVIQAGSGVAISAYTGTADGFVKSHPGLGLQTFVDAIKYSVPYPASKNTDAWAAKEPALAAQAFSGQLSVDAAEKQLATVMNTALAKE
ncbi:ABC transporter substrate-binding protein [uncultured Amnibacterium sp.]|uniref:ABC transporter substrate-binding protein n=1 Tax=uncultured Amnibacterium sp. TaxID=1631851 RepID=UPI0035CA3CDE